MTFDFHTHNLLAPAGEAIINLPLDYLLEPVLFSPRPAALYSVGIHPRWTAEAELLPRLHANLPLLAAHPQIVQIGECGFDRLRGASSISLQSQVFEAHVALSEQLQKPLLIHCVHAYDLLLAARKRLQPSQKWTVHGFRGHAALAAQLLAADFDLSFGKHYNPQAFACTPPDRRRRESDEAYADASPN